MIDRWTVVDSETDFCPICWAETEFTVVDSTEKGRLGYDGQERTCGECGFKRVIRR